MRRGIQVRARLDAKAQELLCRLRRNAPPGNHKAAGSAIEGVFRRKQCQAPQRARIPLLGGANVSDRPGGGAAGGGAGEAAASGMAEAGRGRRPREAAARCPAGAVGQ